VEAGVGRQARLGLKLMPKAKAEVEAETETSRPHD